MPVWHRTLGPFVSFVSDAITDPSYASWSCILSIVCMRCRFIKEYVTCHGRAPEHTTTYSRGTFPEDEPFDMAKWKQGIQIKILEIAEDDVRCLPFA